MASQNLKKRLSMAACTLVAAGQCNNATSADNAWEIDTSYLSYVEADDRVSVSKTLANLSRESDRGILSVNLVHDTMSGASPSGAIRSNNSAVTYTSASGQSGFTAGRSGDYSLVPFDDTRVQVGANWDSLQSNGLTLSYGGAVSQESDYDSIGTNVSLAKESTDRLSTLTTGLALTSDTIYRSGTEDTPEPLANTEQSRSYSQGGRNTIDGLIGFTRVLNRLTLAQLNFSVGSSSGYHSDPYKIISAADDQDRILANFHDSRPDERLRTSVYTKLIHQLPDTENSIHLSYRFYNDDWGIRSHTGDLRYRYQLAESHYLEPHLRLYHQTAADFYQRKLEVDQNLNPILPMDGFASADYRLDQMTSSTLGIKYGVALTPKTDLRVRAEYLDQRFSTADYGTNQAVIFQSSLKYRF